MKEMKENASEMDVKFKALEAEYRELEAKHQNLKESMDSVSKSNIKQKHESVDSKPVATTVTAHKTADEKKTIEDNVKQTAHRLRDTLHVQYILFGTYRTVPKSVELYEDGIQITDIQPNNGNRKFKYDFILQFNDMQRLAICTSPSLPLLMH